MHKSQHKSQHEHNSAKAARVPVQVYNFLQHYYHIKGVKGVKRLTRWSPALEAGGVLLEGASRADIDCGRLSPRGAVETRSGIRYDAREFQRGASREQCSSFLWYRSILSATADAPLPYR